MKNLYLVFIAMLLGMLITGCSQSAKSSTPAPAASPSVTPPTIMSTILASSTAPTSVPPSKAPATEPLLTDPLTISTGLISGAMIGEAGKEVRIYKSIPYAAPPVGDLRWKPPQPPASWTGVRQCTVFSKLAPQTNALFPASYEKSEDCLYLNVLTPAKTAGDRLPVMVFMHGGGYETDSGNNLLYNLPGLPQHGVLLVTVNMRLDVIGLLAHPLLDKESPNGVSGNYMFLDMIAALNWVQSNIGAFGGDPRNVTIFGQSNGSVKVSILMASPLARGLFQKAICESGTVVGAPRPGRVLKDMEIVGEKLFAKLGVYKEADPLKAARALPWEKIIEAGSALVKEIGSQKDVTDTSVDGWFLTDTPSNIFKSGKLNAVPFIASANLGEITGPGMPGFVSPGLTAAIKDMLASAGKAGVKGYAAIFEHVPGQWKAEGCVATHFMELGYVFGDLDVNSAWWSLLFFFTSPAGAKQKNPGFTDVDRKLSEDMMTIWTQFARTGDPSVQGLVTWPSYDSTSDQYLSIDEPLLVKSGFSLIAPKPSSTTTVISTPSPTASPSITPAKPPTGGVYSWEEAGSHIGETATVTGPIVSFVDAKSWGMGENIQLAMGKKLIEAGSVMISLSVDRAKLPADLYQNKTISVTGVILKSQFGGAQITVTDLSQIVVK
jgi:para-nitrobenzyl esterase